MMVFSACVSGPQPTPETLVVERSELGRPGWVESLRSLEPQSEKWFLHTKRELMRLDLGIRQTQASGIAAHCQLLAERMRDEVSTALAQSQAKGKDSDKQKAVVADAAKNNETPPAANSAVATQAEAIEKTITELAASKDCPELELKDVYWEAIRRQTPDGPRTSYDVYVLLSLKQVHFDEVLAMTANSLKLSGRADLAPVAEVLIGRMSQSLQKGTNE
ncbi:MAG: hypothetical protein RLZZ488_179 [Pseudomonadota bacterium]